MLSTVSFFRLLFWKDCIQILEVLLGLCQTSKLEIFCENSKEFVAVKYIFEKVSIVHNWRFLTRPL